MSAGFPGTLAAESTPRERLNAVMREAALTVGDKIKEILIEAGTSLLAGARLTFCMHNRFGIRQEITLEAVFIPRAFDHPILSRDILKSDGVFSCDYCSCGSGLAFSSLKPYPSEYYMSSGPALLSSIERLVADDKEKRDKEGPFPGLR